MRINNNMSAVITNNQLLGTEDTLADVMEKLSSGFSINHASDNPSGIAIAGKMQAQIEGLAQASTNSSDGISVLQTAEGALNEVTDMIQRMRELSVQAANGTNSISEKETIQKEINSLLEEIDRVAESTEFNNINLLNGALDNRTYAEHATRIQTSDSVAAGPYQLKVDEAATHAKLGDVNTLLAGETNLQVAGSVLINGYGVELAAGMDRQDVYEAMRNACENAGATISHCQDGTNNVYIESSKYGAHADLKLEFSSKEFAEALGFDTDEFNVKISNQTVGDSNPLLPGMDTLDEDGTVEINGYTAVLKSGMTRAEVYEALYKACKESGATISECGDGIEKIKIEGVGNNPVKVVFSTKEFAQKIGFNADELEAGTLLTQSVGTDPKITLTRDSDNNNDHKTSMFGDQATYKADGNHVTVTDVNGFEFSFLLEEGFDALSDTTSDAGQEGVINFNVTDIGSMTFHVGANKNQNMEVRIAAVTTEFMYIDDLNVIRVNGAEDALSSLDEALSYVTSVRSQLGAYENRLDHTTKSLDTTEENMTAAISRIEDADMATTMVEYTKLNVLEQAGTSALAQANELPQLALQLLQ